MKRSRHLATVVAVGAAVLLAGTAGVAAGAGAGGGPWLLGELNQAKQTTKLISNAGLDKATVRIKNKGQGPALSLATRQSQAPFTVTSRAKVNRLNADQIDGLDSSQLVQVPATPLSAHVLNPDPTSVPDTTLTDLSTYLETYDPSDMHWAANPSSMMAPRTGTYVVSATVTWAANAVGWRSAELRTQDVVVGRVTGPPAGASVPTVQTLHGVVHLEAGRGVRLQVSQSSGGGALGATMTAFEFAYVGS